VTPYFQFIFKIFLKSVALCLITNPYNPKYSRLQNKNRFHVNANGHLRKYGVTRFSDDHSMCFSILRVPTHVTPCECYDRMWGHVLVTSSITLTANLIHGSYIITLGIKHGQNININSRKPGFITFHQ
jgi:hypothetical protein